MIVYPSEINGEVIITGAKNAILRHLAASILFDGTIVLQNSPISMLDVDVHLKMLKVLGKTIQQDKDVISISGEVSTVNLQWEERAIRNTLLILGALLAKKGEGRVPLPGGCQLGDRKYDIHVSLMEAFGAKVWQEDNYLCAKTDKTQLQGCSYQLPIRSTGATENGIIMGCLAQGTTEIWNPHIRPEILDLILLLNKMGAHIKVNGQESIVIEGIKRFSISYVEHSVLSDNMQALTYLIAGAMSGKELLIKNIPFEDLEVPITFLNFSGLNFYRKEKCAIVRKCNPFPVDICTGPYPGINSDMQPLFAAWGALARGVSSITDLRFVGRYQYAYEFLKMGIKSSVADNKLTIYGTEQVHGANVTALDLRAGAALLLLGLVADSPTVINDFWMIERGYDQVEKNLQSIGVHLEND